MSIDKINNIMLALADDGAESGSTSKASSQRKGSGQSAKSKNQARNNTASNRQTQAQSASDKQADQGKTSSQNSPSEKNNDKQALGANDVSLLGDEQGLLDSANDQEHSLLNEDASESSADFSKADNFAIDSATKDAASLDSSDSASLQSPAASTSSKKKSRSKKATAVENKSESADFDNLEIVEESSFEALRTAKLDDDFIIDESDENSSSKKNKNSNAVVDGGEKASPSEAALPSDSAEPKKRKYNINPEAGMQNMAADAANADSEQDVEEEDEYVEAESPLSVIRRLLKRKPKPKKVETRKDWIKALKKTRRKSPVNLEGAERIDVDVKMGLNSEQVDQQIKRGYVNISSRRTGKTYLGIILSNTFTFFNILAFCVAIAMLFTSPSFAQMFFIFIIFANIVIGIIQEIKAKLSVDKLHIITAPSAMVIRDGEQKLIPLDEVVLDDIIHLETGRQIAADSIVISGECEVNESMITGESVSVKKAVGDVLYSGSFLSSGNIYARVDKVGDANYAQSLTSSAKKYQKPKSELNDSIRLIMKIATIFIIPITFSMIMIYIFQNKGTTTENAIRGISGAVIGMIPAGMFLLTTVALASSMLRLASKKTLVKDLYCIEMLARVDTLCLDKTGTITDGSMSVKKVIKFKMDENAVAIEGVIGSMLSSTEDNNQTALALAARFGYSQEYKARAIVPFSSQRKYSMVSFDEIGTYILGAPEFVLKDMGVRLEKLINENTSAGYRVIMLVHSPSAPEADKLPANRKPVCMIVIEDQIREDAIETIKWFKENDVAVKVISGDNPVTVSEIARRVGVENAELYISLDGLSDQEIIEAASKYTVFGRVTPEQKSLLVKSMKVKGHTVAMTGDGVNDILAMREADCAIAIASGAEAARNVSHLVLVDNNFTAMPYIVLEGRKVVNNIQKSSILFLMKTIMSIFLALIYVIQRKPYPITTENLLLLELFIIGVPSFFLALQPNQNRIQGKFLVNVIGRALPGGLALVLGVISVDIFALFVSDAMTTDIRMSMIVICLSFTGLIVLCKVCEPFNFYRAFFVIFSALAIFAAIMVGGSQFGIKDFTSDTEYFAITCVLFIVSEVLLSYFVITMITKLLKRANIIFD